MLSLGLLIFLGALALTQAGDDETMAMVRELLEDAPYLG